MIARLLRWVDLAHQWIVALGTLVIVGPLTWWAIDDVPAREWKSVEVINPEVPAGGVLRLKVTYEQKRSCDGYRILTVIDGQGIRFDSRQIWTDTRKTGEAAEYGKAITSLVIVQIPAAAAPGPGVHYASYHDFCNPLQRMFSGLGILSWRPEVTFEILPGRLALARPEHPDEQSGPH